MKEGGKESSDVLESSEREDSWPRSHFCMNLEGNSVDCDSRKVNMLPVASASGWAARRTPSEWNVQSVCWRRKFSEGSSRWKTKRYAASGRKSGERESSGET